MSSSIPNASGIYRITCTATGKFYIGSAVNLRKRRNEHFEDLRHNIHGNPKLQNAWNKYGPDTFIFEILEYVLLPEMLTMREQYYLDKLKPWGKKGFNIARVAGSPLGVKRSPETIEKKRLASLGKKHSPETREKLRNFRLGTKASPETKEKMRDAKLASHPRRVKLIATAPNGTEYAVNGIVKFCEEHNLSPSQLIKVARGTYSQCKGWTAHYPEKDRD